MLFLLKVLAFVVAIGLTFFLANFYASKRTPFTAILLTCLGWLMGLLIIFLLPVDIYMVLKYMPNIVCQ